MDFGKVDDQDFNNVDFTLPPDGEGTTRVLQNTTAAGKKVELFVGCAKWGRKDWVGKIYPEGTKEGDFLSLYAQYFNCIELNATFYKLPSVKQVTAWREKVGQDFRFCPKFNDKITHKKRLKDAEHYTNIFLEGVAAFGPNLGPVFLQTPPNYATKNLEVLDAYLEALPQSLDIFVELRHPGWFTDEAVNKKVFTMLEKHGAGAVITDAAGRRDCVHMNLTTPSAFIRFVGNSLHPTDYQRCNDWITRLKSWVDKGIERIYFLMHQKEEVFSPELCRYFIGEANKAGIGNLPEPRFL